MRILLNPTNAPYSLGLITALSAYSSSSQFACVANGVVNSGDKKEVSRVLRRFGRVGWNQRAGEKNCYIRSQWYGNTHSPAHSTSCTSGRCPLPAAKSTAAAAALTATIPASLGMGAYGHALVSEPTPAAPACRCFMLPSGRAKITCKPVKASLCLAWKPQLSTPPLLGPWSGPDVMSSVGHSCSPSCLYLLTGCRGQRLDEVIALVAVGGVGVPLAAAAARNGGAPAVDACGAGPAAGCGVMGGGAAGGDWGLCLLCLEGGGLHGRWV